MCFFFLIWLKLVADFRAVLDINAQGLMVETIGRRRWSRWSLEGRDSGSFSGYRGALDPWKRDT